MRSMTRPSEVLPPALTLDYALQCLFPTPLSILYNGNLPLLIHHPFLILQIYLPAQPKFLLQVQVNAHKSSFLLQLANFQSECAYVIDGLVEERWFNLVIDLDYFSSRHMGQRVDSFSKVVLQAECRLKKMFSVRQFHPHGQLASVFSYGSDNNITCQLYSDFSKEHSRPLAKISQPSQVFRLEKQEEHRQHDGRVANKVLTYGITTSLLANSTYFGGSKQDPNEYHKKISKIESIRQQLEHSEQSSLQLQTSPTPGAPPSHRPIHTQQPTRLPKLRQRQQSYNQQQLKKYDSQYIVKEGPCHPILVNAHRHRLFSNQSQVTARPSQPRPKFNTINLRDLQQTNHRVQGLKHVASTTHLHQDQEEIQERIEVDSEGASSNASRPKDNLLLPSHQAESQTIQSYFEQTTG